jgi:hypothetical protein
VEVVDIIWQLCCSLLLEAGFLLSLNSTPSIWEIYLVGWFLSKLLENDLGMSSKRLVSYTEMYAS